LKSVASIILLLTFFNAGGSLSLMYLSYSVPGKFIMVYNL